MILLRCGHALCHVCMDGSQLLCKMCDMNLSLQADSSVEDQSVTSVTKVAEGSQRGHNTIEVYCCC